MYVEVLVEITNKNVDKTFTYHVVHEMEKDIQKGIRVEVPFQNRTLEGFILGISNVKPDYDVRDVLRVVDYDVILNDELMELGKYLKNLTLSSLMICYQAMLPKALKAKKGVVVAKKYQTYLRLENQNYVPSNNVQEQILALFQGNVLLKKDAISISSSAVKTLLHHGVISEFQEEIYRGSREKRDKRTFCLTSLQKEAVCKIWNSPLLVHLLHGVTGSGKTEVYMTLIEGVLKQNRQAIVLVPEISLTEQIVGRFLERFDRIAVLHSKLSDGEKYDEYRKIAGGEVDIVIGARSAVFAPLKNIGLIIIDEEQSTSFKQDNQPRYRALDVAIWRMEKHGGKVVLGSATPSLESYARAKRGVYQLIEMPHRVHSRHLPEVSLVDMNHEVKKGNSILSSSLKQKIQFHIEKGYQVLLLLNRRGYASFLSCKNCGHVIKCPHCDITLTYHKSSQTLRCHYCGYGEKLLKICPNCHEDSLSTLGTGTEKVEEQLQEVFSEARILRMDLDTTSKKGAIEKMVEAFRNHEYDILLGTQIVAKGLDFPLVTLVGVINADTSLQIPDFRSGEDTFQLLSQVAGRSGRSEAEGEVIIQTFNPEHYAIQYAKHHNYLGFYEQEMKFRKQLGYPPYYYLTTVLITGENYQKCMGASQQIGVFLKQELRSSIILGPTVAGVMKINNLYRFQIIIKYKKEENLYKVLSYLLEHYMKNRTIRLDVDFFPNHF